MLGTGQQDSETAVQQASRQTQERHRAAQHVNVQPIRWKRLTKQEIHSVPVQTVR